MKAVRAGWDHALLVCGKCSRRAGGPRLAKLLRALPGHGKRRRDRVGVVEVKCLGLCPKRGVVVVDTRDPGRWLVVDPRQGAGALPAPGSSSPGSTIASPNTSRT